MEPMTVVFVDYNDVNKDGQITASGRFIEATPPPIVGEHVWTKDGEGNGCEGIVNRVYQSSFPPGVMLYAIALMQQTWRGA